jgi:hypothetical protein
MYVVLNAQHTSAIGRAPTLEYSPKGKATDNQYTETEGGSAEQEKSEGAQTSPKNIHQLISYPQRNTIT